MEAGSADAERAILDKPGSLRSSGYELWALVTEGAVSVALLAVAARLVASVSSDPAFAGVPELVGGEDYRMTSAAFLQVCKAAIVTYGAYMAALIAVSGLPGALAALLEPPGGTSCAIRRTAHHVYAVREPAALCFSILVVRYMYGDALLGSAAGPAQSTNTPALSHYGLAVLAFAAAAWLAACVVYEAIEYVFFVSAFAQRIRDSNGALEVLRTLYARACGESLGEAPFDACALRTASGTALRGDLDDEDRCVRIAGAIFAKLSGGDGRDEESKGVSLESLKALLEPKDHPMAVRLFDADASGSITEQNLADATLAVAYKRSTLTAALRGTARLFAHLRGVLATVTAAVTAVYAATLLDLSATSLAVGVVVALGAAETMFTSSLSETLTCAIFVFGTHAYDVGDYVVVGSVSSGRGAQSLRVRTVDLYRTVFETDDGTLVYRLNSEVSAQPVVNLRRAGALLEPLAADVAVPAGLAAADAAAKVRDALALFCRTRPRDYTGAVVVRAVRPVDGARARLELLVGLPPSHRERPGRAERVAAVQAQLDLLVK